MYVLPTPYICTYIHVLPCVASARQMVPGVPSHMMPFHDASRLRCRVSLPCLLWKRQSTIETVSVHWCPRQSVQTQAAAACTCALLPKYRQPTLLLHLSMAPSAGGAMQHASTLLSRSMPDVTAHILILVQRPKGLCAGPRRQPRRNEKPPARHWPCSAVCAFAPRPSFAFFFLLLDPEWICRYEPSGQVSTRGNLLACPAPVEMRCKSLAGIADSATKP